MASDYIKFLKRIHEYVNTPITFIKPSDSRWVGFSQVSGDKRFGSYPIGKLELVDESIEIFFLHYHTKQEALDKWKRRCQRINWEKLLVKFNDQNQCTEEHIKQFVALPYAHKLFFTVKKWSMEEFYKEALMGGVLQNKPVSESG